MSTFLPKTVTVAALRAAADLIDKLPDDYYWFVEAQSYQLTAEGLADAIRLGGTWEKDATNDLFRLSQGIVELHVERNKVCVAVATGRTTTVKKVVSTVTEDVEVPEVEWRCEPLLAKAQS